MEPTETRNEFRAAKDQFKTLPDSFSQDLISLSLTSKSLLLKCFLGCYLEKEVVKTIHQIDDERNIMEIFQKVHTITRYQQYLLNSHHLKQKQIDAWNEWFSIPQDTSNIDDVYVKCPVQHQQELKTKILDLARYSIRKKIPTDDGGEYVSVCHLLPDLHPMHNAIVSYADGRQTIYVYTDEEMQKKQAMHKLRESLFIPIPSRYDNMEEDDMEENEEDEEHQGEELMNCDSADMVVSKKVLDKVRTKLDIGQEICDKLLVNALVFVLPWSFKMIRSSLPYPIFFQNILISGEEDEDEDEERPDESTSPTTIRNVEISPKGNQENQIFKLNEDVMIHILSYLRGKHVIQFSQTCSNFYRNFLNSGWSFIQRFSKQLNTLLSVTGNSLATQYIKDIKYFIKQTKFKTYVALSKGVTPFPVTYQQIKYHQVDCKSSCEVIMKIGNTTFKQIEHDDMGVPSFRIYINPKKSEMELEGSPFDCSGGVLTVQKSAITLLRSITKDLKSTDEELIVKFINCLPWDSDWNLVFYNSRRIKIVDK